MKVMWRVDELLRERGWSIADLARKANIDEKTARNIVNGTAKRVDLTTMAKLAEALDVQLGRLWETDRDRQAAWDRIRGIAGPPQPGEIERVLRGEDWDVDTDPSLERATRDLGS